MKNREKKERKKEKTHLKWVFSCMGLLVPTPCNRGIYIMRDTVIVGVDCPLGKIRKIKV